jgi:hypothetical protein
VLYESTGFVKCFTSKKRQGYEDAPSAPARDLFLSVLTGVYIVPSVPLIVLEVPPIMPPIPLVAIEVPYIVPSVVFVTIEITHIGTPLGLILSQISHLAVAGTDITAQLFPRCLDFPLVT